MATFQISGPDGKKYRVTGDNAEGALQALQQHLGTAQEPQTQTPEPKQDMSFMAPTMSGVGKGLQTIDDAVRGAANGLTFGMADRFAGMMEGQDTEGLIRGESATDKQRRLSAEAKERSPVAYTGGEIGGSVLGMGKMMNAGATAGRLIPQGLSGGKALIAKMLAGGVDGLVANEAMNAGYGREFGENAGIAGALGAGAVPLGQVVSKGVDLGKAALGMGNEPRAKKAILDALMRSGKSVDDVATDMTQAVDDGQGVYNLADAMGNSGQRMLSGVARSPGDMRQTIAETLMSRQAGQGDRLTNALVEGFDAPMTSAQKTAAMTSNRGATANANYDAARNSASAVNVDNVIAQIDQRLAPMIGQGVTGDGIDDILSQFRNRLAVPKSNLPDGVTSKTLSEFDRVLGVKQDLGDAIEAASRSGKNNQARELRKIYDQLDASLEDASISYRNANDTFRRQSREIEAVETGKTAVSGRVRSQDSIPQFNAMNPDEQAAFRTGYSDPMIAKVQAAAGPGTNKARMLDTDKTKAEFPQFAAPGKTDQLARRIGREKTMFETTSTALGGSKTADNLQDISEMGGIDPSMVMNVLGGNWKQAALAGVTKAGNALSGRNSATRDMIAKALLSTGKEAPKQIFQAIEAGKKLTAKQQTIARILMAAALPMVPAN